MAYPMTDEDRAIQDAMRRFVDEELIPFEVEAELHDGVIAEDAVQRQKARLREMGLSAINMPKELGGDGLTMFQQVLVSEQIGRVTNAIMVGKSSTSEMARSSAPSSGTHHGACSASPFSSR